MAGPLGGMSVMKAFPAGDASGGTITTDGYRKYHTFVSNGTFVRGSVSSVDIYGLSGGGSAGDGQSGSFYDAGGAGGVIRELDDQAIAADLAITVGAGGNYANGSSNGTDGVNGGSTIIGSLVTVPGGHGGGIDGARKGGDNADFVGSIYGGGGNNNSGAGAGAGGNGSQAPFNSTGGIGKIGLMDGTRRGGGGAGGGNQGGANVGGDGGGGGYGVAGTDEYGGGGGHAARGGSGLGIVAYVSPTAPTLAAGPPTYIGAGTNAGAAGTIDKPAGLANGDLLIIQAVKASVQYDVPTTSTGFRVLYNRYDQHSALFYKIVDGSEPANWTPAALGISGYNAFRSYAFRGVNARHIMDCQPVAGAQANAGITTLYANTLVVCFNSMGGFSGGAISDVTNGFTAGPFQAGGSGSASYGFAYKFKAVPGAVGSTNFPSTHGSSTTLMIGLRANTPPTSPIDILSSRCLAWWDGTDVSAASMTFGVGNAIAVWKDKTANARNLDKANTNAPTSQTNVINGLPVVEFDPVALSGFVRNSQFMYSNNTIEIWVVSKSDDAVNGTFISEGKSSTAAEVYRLLDLNATDQHQFTYSDPANVDRFVTAASRGSGSAWRLTIATDYGTAVGTKCEVVGVATATSGAYTRPATSFDRLSIGVCIRNSSSLFYDGQIAEIFVITSAATANERAALTAYINTKYAQTWAPA